MSVCFNNGVDVLPFYMEVWSDKNVRDVEQVDLTIHFVDGVSESQSVNELFSYMSRYVQARGKNE